MTQKAKVQTDALINFYENVSGNAIVTVVDATKIRSWLESLGNEFNMNFLKDWDENFITKAELQKFASDLKAKGDIENSEIVLENFDDEAGLYWRNEDPYVFEVVDYNDTLITVVQTLRLSEINELEEVAQTLDNNNK